MAKMMTAYEVDTSHPNYGALAEDYFDVGQVVGEQVALQIFKRRDNEYSLQYATVDWKKEADPDNIPWDVNNNEERGQHWRLVYRFYPEKTA